jgi:hypothetical protein
VTSNGFPAYLRAVGAAIALLTSIAAVAQEPLTLDSAVQAVLAQNASLRAARAGKEEATAGVTGICDSMWSCIIDI